MFRNPAPKKNTPIHGKVHYAGNPSVPKSSPEKKGPPARSRFPHPLLCTDLRILPIPALKKVPRPNEGFLMTHHVTSRCVAPCRVASCRVASRHVTTMTTICDVSVWGCCTGIIRTHHLFVTWHISTYTYICIYTYVCVCMVPQVVTWHHNVEQRVLGWSKFRQHDRAVFCVKMPWSLFGPVRLARSVVCLARKVIFHSLSKPIFSGKLGPHVFGLHVPYLYIYIYIYIVYIYIYLFIHLLV